MGAKTKIAWCHHTMNLWWGCHKVSPACKNCYAESFSKRTGHRVWGADAPRRFFGDAHWREPVKWNAAAEKAGERRRVFCGSMMDVLELHPLSAVHVDQNLARRRLFALIGATPWLDWLLLTKRPENFAECFPDWAGGLPRNIWMGTTVEDQEYADLRIPHLLKIPALVRFLSCEPLLGPVDLRLRYASCDACGGRFDVAARACPSCGDRHKISYGSAGIHWVIAGGESGHHHREHQLEWSRSLRDQCAEAAVSFFFKQLGEAASEFKPFADAPGRRRLPLTRGSKGEALDEIPLDLRVREFPRSA